MPLTFMIENSSGRVRNKPILKKQRIGCMPIQFIHRLMLIRVDVLGSYNVLKH